MIVRRELPQDRSAILGVHLAAFGGEAEARLVEELRHDGDALPGLSLVALLHADVVGHVAGSRADVDGRPAVGLGPLGVRPDHQRRGVGAALLHAALGAADALGEPAVVLLGDPAHYRRFGFVPAVPLGLLPPDPCWAPHFQVRRLTAWDPSLRGTFRYAPAFDRLERRVRETADMPKQSAGVLLYRRRGGLEVFLVHPGGPYWARKDDGAWSIPKGELDPGEEPLAAARRELAEETGFTVDGPYLPLPPVRQPGGKLVTAFAAEADVDPAALSSATFPLEWPPRSGRHLDVAEVDRGDWFTLPEARTKLLRGQLPLLDHLAAALAVEGPGG